MAIAFQVVQFYEGRMKLPTGIEPRDWHPRAEIIYITGDVPDEVLWIVAEIADEMGWTFNPHTRTFIKKK
jgi:hypothetical protein